MAAVTPSAFGLGALVVALAAVTLLWPWGLFALGVGVASSWGVGHFLSRRLDGLTGDSLGAAVEVAELGVLLAFASLHHLGLL
jgi:cobalamin synthase